MDVELGGIHNTFVLVRLTFEITSRGGDKKYAFPLCITLCVIYIYDCTLLGKRRVSDLALYKTSKQGKFYSPPTLA